MGDDHANAAQVLLFGRIPAVERAVQYAGQQANLVTTDSHSPGKVRVNAVLSATDDFYDAFGITEQDAMYDRIWLGSLQKSPNCASSRMQMAR